MVFRRGLTYNSWWGKAHSLSSVSMLWWSDSPHKGQVEADWQLEVQLNGCTLVVTTNCIFDLNVNLQRHTNNYSVVQTFRELLILAGNTKKLIWPWVHKRPHLQGSVSMAPQTHSGCSPIAVEHEVQVNIQFKSKQRKEITLRQAGHNVVRNLFCLIHFYIMLPGPVQI